jgi:preprotein translocase subunit YajC
MLKWLRNRKRKTEVKRVRDLKVGDRIVYPTGVGEVTSFQDEKRIEATGSMNIRFFKMDMVAGPHRGSSLRDGLPWEDTIEVHKMVQPPKLYTQYNAMAYTTCAFILGSMMSVPAWLT